MMRHRWRSAFEFARVFVAMDEEGIKVSILFHANGFRRPIEVSQPLKLQSPYPSVSEVSAFLNTALISKESVIESQ
jgi:hypothetical protein